MKKVLLIILAALLIVGAVAGVCIGVNSCKKDTETVKASVDYLQETYTAGDTIVFRVVAFSDKQLTSVKYCIDNGAEVLLTSTTGDAKDSNKYNVFKSGKYYIDTGTETVDSTDLNAGEHLIKFYAYEGTTRYQINSAKMFTIVEAASANAD